jgi:cytochrome c oxidase cbb3-type subunit 2
MRHESIEKNVALIAVLTFVAISFGGLAEIVPLLFQRQLAEPIEGLRPLTALELEGRDIYIREGCVGCHSQMVRPLRAETERYGHYSVAGESVWNHPFLWGSKRTGPDLARVGGRYSDEWHRLHLIDPRSLVPESNMPAFPWLGERTLDGARTGAKMRALRSVGVPYAEEDIEGAQAAVAGRTESEAVIAFLQQLGTHLERQQ